MGQISSASGCESVRLRLSPTPEVSDLFCIADYSEIDFFSPNLIERGIVASRVEQWLIAIAKPVVTILTVLTLASGYE